MLHHRRTRPVLRRRARARLRPLLLCAVLAPTWAPAPAPLAAQVPLDSAALHAWMQQVRADNDLPGFTVAVARDGRIVFSHGVGVADLDTGTPATGRTVLNVASVSKVLAVTGLMKLVAEGRIDLDAPVQEYLPYYPEKRWPMTVRQVLTHTSGTRHYAAGEFGPYREREMRHYDDFEEATRIWRDDPLLYEPGTRWLYSSHAMNLQHGLVEAASGEDFETYLRENVWEPAGMLATRFDVPERVVVNRGKGYLRDGRGAFVNPPFADVSYKYAGGGMLSTVEDLVRFTSALNRGRILRPGTLEEMWRPQIDASVPEYEPDEPGSRGEPLDFRQALAWRVRPLGAGDDRVVYHTGTVKGTRTYVGTVPELDLSVAIQANALPFDSQRYGEALLLMLLPPAHAGP